MPWIGTTCCQSANPEQVPDLLYVGSSQGNQYGVSLLSTSVPATGFCTYRLPSFDGAEQTRNRRKRPKRVKLFGRGNLVNGIVILCYNQNQYQQYAFTGTFDSAQELLVWQEFLPVQAREMDVTFVLFGTNIEINDCRMEYVDID